MESNGANYHFSGVAIIIFAALGILVFILLFIFAKRQIVRFALKSHHSLHAHIGLGAPKRLKLEIERRLNVVRDIKCEPNLLALYSDLDNGENKSHHHENLTHLYRMKAVDSLSTLETALINVTKEKYNPRPAGQDLRYYLLRFSNNDGPLSNCDLKVINQFVDLYQMARHEPIPVFGIEEYKQYMNLLNILCNAIKYKQSQSPGKVMATHDDREKVRETSAQVVINGKTQVSVVEVQETSETQV